MIEIINTATNEIIQAHHEFKDHFEVIEKRWVMGSIYAIERKLIKHFWKRTEHADQTSPQRRKRTSKNLD